MECGSCDTVFLYLVCWRYTQNATCGAVLLILNEYEKKSYSGRYITGIASDEESSQTVVTMKREGCAFLIKR